MLVINMLGKTCPIPVIETKNAIRKLGDASETIRVLVDNEIACQNLEKMADGLGCKNSYKKITDDKFEMDILVGTGGTIKESKQGVGKTVVAIGQDTMGNGEAELGKILIKGFIYSLTELMEVPSCIVFFNSGAKLVCEGANTIEDLNKLELLGCKIFVCGTCIDYYGLKEKVQIGEITNMYGIVTILNTGEKVINI